MEQVKLNCTGMNTRLAELLLDPGAAPAKVRMHVEECGRCRAELDELRATMALLDSWEGPEPTPYFLTRLEARLREQREAESAGLLAIWFSRLRDGFVYGPRRHVRPLAAMAFTVVLLIGGGTYLNLANWDQTVNPPTQAAVVHDLQTLDNNAQLLDQLESLSSTNEHGD